MGFSHIVQMGARREMPWMSWSPTGDRLAYFVRTEKERTLIIQNVLTRRIELRIPMKTVDEPESPTFSPDGRTVAFAALRGGVGDIFTLDLQTSEIVNVTVDEFSDAAPTFSRDGRFLIYNARVSGNQKLFRLDLDTKRKTQITFGTVDETAAQFIDDNTIVFSSTATNPAVPLDPAVARNGNIYNIWTLDLRTGELRQFTDVLGGNWSPAVLNEGQTSRIAFITYYKGEHSIRALERTEPLHTGGERRFRRARPDHRLPGARAAHAHRGQRAQEEAVREDVSGGTAAGQRRRHEQRRRLRRIANQLRRHDGRPAVQRLHRVDRPVPDDGRVVRQSLAALPVGAAGLLADDLLLRADQQRLLRPCVFGLHRPRRRAGDPDGSRRDRARHLPDRSLPPCPVLRRVHPAPRAVQRRRAGTSSRTQYQQQNYGTTLFRNGSMMPLGVEFVQETTVFREFGPLAGNTVRLAYDASPKMGGLLSRQTVDADLRHYLRLGTTGLLATRLKGFKSFGDFPDFTYFGGNSELRGYDYLEFSGQNAMFANAELRFPLIEAALTPVGVIGGIRGVFFANIGGAWFDNQPSPTRCSGASGYKFWTSDSEICTPILGVQTNAAGFPILNEAGQPIEIQGSANTRSRASG